MRIIELNLRRLEGRRVVAATHLRQMLGVFEVLSIRNGIEKLRESVHTTDVLWRACPTARQAGRVDAARLRGPGALVRQRVPPGPLRGHGC